MVAALACGVIVFAAEPPASLLLWRAVAIDLPGQRAGQVPSEAGSWTWVAEKR